MQSSGAHARQADVIEDGFSRGFGRKDALALACEVFLLVQAAYYYSFVPSIKIVAIVVLGMVLVACLWAVERFVEHDDAEAFLARAFPVVLILLVVGHAAFFPPQTTPDEPYHFRKSYAYSNILLGQDLGQMREEDYPLTQMNPFVESGSWQNVAGRFSLMAGMEGNRIYAELQDVNFAANLPYLKVPSAMGIALARIVGLGGIPLYFLGRIFNGLYAVAMIVLAVRLAPAGRNLMRTIALMPMTLSMLGSHSYDAPIIGMAFLLSALVLRALFSEGRVGAPLVGAIVALAILIAPCKLVYSLLALAIFAVPSSRFESPWLARAVKAGVIALPAVAIALIRMSALSSMATQEASAEIAVRGVDSGHWLTFGYLVAHPGIILRMIPATLNLDAYYLVMTFVGGRLGQLQMSLDCTPTFVMLIVGMIVAAASATRDDARQLTGRQRAILALVLAAGIALIYASMMVSHTFVEDASIRGVQGRYLIPYAPLALLALRSSRIRIGYALGYPLLLALLAANMGYLGYVAMQILMG